MELPKKKEGRIEYIKRLLKQDAKLKCEYCKYYLRNYDKWYSLDEHVKQHFLEKCKSCIHSPKYVRIKKEETRKKYYWFRDNFKPLYDWEEINLEGEQNGSG